MSVLPILQKELFDCEPEFKESLSEFIARINTWVEFNNEHNRSNSKLEKILEALEKINSLYQNVTFQYHAYHTFCDDNNFTFIIDKLESYDEEVVNMPRQLANEDEYEYAILTTKVKHLGCGLDLFEEPDVLYFRNFSMICKEDLKQIMEIYKRNCAIKDILE